MVDRRTVRRAVSAIFAALAISSGIGTASAADGAALFDTHCAACHQAGGVGAPGLAPPLVSKRIAAAGAKSPSYVALVVLNGLSGSVPLDDGSSMSGIMPPVGLSLSDEEVAAVASYVLGTLNGAQAPLDAGTVAGLRSQKPAAKDLRAMREELKP